MCMEFTINGVLVHILFRFGFATDFAVYVLHVCKHELYEGNGEIVLKKGEWNQQGKNKTKGWGWFAHLKLAKKLFDESGMKY